MRLTLVGFQIARDFNMASVVYSTVTVAPHHTPLLRLDNSLYYWRVTPIDNKGHAGAALLPMKFATIYFDMARLDNLFEEQFEEFETVLEHLRGHQEWGVKVYIDQALLLEHIDDYSSAVQELRAEMHSKSQGAAYFLARRLQEVVTEEFERVSFAVADETHGSLGDLSRATLLSALPPAAPDEAERLVLSGVYLVAQANTTPFAAAVDELAERHAGHGFRLEISGPWPAYNFVDLAWLQEERS